MKLIRLKGVFLKVLKVVRSCWDREVFSVKLPAVVQDKLRA